MATQELEITTARVEGEASERAGRLRSRMRGQVETAGLQAVEAEYGLIRPYREIAARVRAVLPRRPFRVRHVICREIEEYQGFIPDAALLRWFKAKETGGFQGFCVMWPTYQRERRPPDPWLIGWTSIWLPSIHRHMEGSDRGVVLAYWDDERLHPKQAR